MPFPQNFMDELTARNEIVDVISGYVPLTKRGRDYWACCPFHSEKTPSFSVQPEAQFFYCFGCKKGGDVIHFIMAEENLSFPDAVRFLARRAGMEVPEDGGDREEAQRRKRLLDLNRDAAMFYYRLLQAPEGQAVRAYLDRRKISRKTAVKFGMGASADAWDVLLRTMTSKGYAKEELLDAGLVVKGKKGGLYDKFRNRLMLPVIDTSKNVVGFGSRVLDASEPKYMNTSDTPVYSKRRVLYGLNLAKKTKRPNIILCEGNLDVVTLHQAGFDNAVASMGTALTPEQVRLLARFTKELVLCYDNDNAGKTATERALQILNRSGLSVRVLQLPRRETESGDLVKQDPDDYIKYHGADSFERMLSGSENGTDFRMEEIAGKYDLKTDEGRLGFSAEVWNLIASLQSSVERKIYTHRAAEIAGVPDAVMEADAQRAAKTRYARERRAEERRELNPSSQVVQPQDSSLRYENVRSARAEEGIVRLLLKDDGLFPNQPPLTEEQFSSTALGRAFSLLWRAREERRPVTLNALSGELSPEEMSHIVSICQKPESSENAPRALKDYIRIIREQSRKRMAGASTSPRPSAGDHASKTADGRIPPGHDDGSHNSGHAAKTASPGTSGVSDDWELLRAVTEKYKLRKDKGGTS